MAMALRFFITCLVMTVCIVASVDATISCFSVAFRLSPCVDYLRNGGDAPPSLCCYGVTSLNNMAQTTPDRQQACECMKSNSKLIPGLNETIAAGLPAKCGVNIPYPISLNTDCNTVK